MREEADATEGIKGKHPPSPSSSDEGDVGEEPVRLDWRLDPEESHSDWKIEICVSGGEIREIYHVHRASLSVLSNRSEYFARLFANKGHAEHETHANESH